MASAPTSPRRATSTLRPPNGLSASLQRSTSQASLRRRSALVQGYITGRKHTKDDYDGEYKQALLNGSETGIGLRSWYANFTSIDWLHDQCKDDFRLTKLRARPGIRGFIANNWDRFQGWIAIALIGAFTAVIAAGIIAFETFLFTAKDGYCTTGFWKAKRFCTCPSSAIINKAAESTQKLVSFPSTTFIKAWAHPAKDPHCHAWREWGAVLDGHGSRYVQWMLEYGVYIVLALSFATFASVLTIYLSASDQVVSTKDTPTAGRKQQADAEPSPMAEARLSRTFSYPSYGAMLFSERQGISRSSSFHEALSEAQQAAAKDGQNQNELNTSAPVAAPRKVMYFAAGSGIPEIKTLLGGFVIRGYLGGWTLLAKAVGLCFSVGSGLSLGKEGPFVHIASCVGNIVSRFFPKFDQNEAKRRELLSAACAAGVAVSFGAPVGGVLFSLEEVSYHFPPKVMFRSFVCAMIAATVLKAFDPFGSGKIVLFEVTYDKDWHFVELFGFIALGIFGGLYGALFNKANLAWVKRVRNGTSLKKHPILEVAAVCLVTVIISYLNPFTRMGGTELVYEMFSECSRDDPLTGLCIRQPSQVWPLLRIIGFAMVAKALLTVITFGIKLPAGIFIPTLAVGACFGRILGLLLEYGYAMHPTSPLFGFCSSSGPLPAPFGQACILPGVWAVVGAAATLAGVTRTTVSLAVIIFELTGSLTYVTPVMIAVLFAKTVADAVETRSIYDLTIEANNLPYLDAKEEHILHGSVMDVVDTEADCISLELDVTVATLTRQLADNATLATGFPIIKDDDGLRLQGYIGFDELEQAIEAYNIMAGSEVPPTPCSFRHITARIHFEETENVASPSGTNVLDLGYLVDRAPVTISSRAPLQLVHQYFIRLGVRYLAVQDERGCYVGMIDKNRWLGYLKWLETQKH